MCQSIYISSNDLVFGNTPTTKSNVSDYLVWTEYELRLLGTTLDFKSKKAYVWVN